MTPLETLRHHVSGAIERGEKEAIAEVRGPFDTDYTAGPWEIYGIQEHKGQRKAIVQASRPYPRSVTVAIVQAETIFDSELKANANLVAAAPELYEALKDLFARAVALDQSATHNGMKNCDAIRAAREALAKAEGNQ